MIGSGPTVGTAPGPAEVFAILAANGIVVSPAIAAAIRSTGTSRRPSGESHPVHLLATPAMALSAAAAKPSY